MMKLYLTILFFACYYTAKTNSNEIGTFLQLTDIHLDLQYQPGSPGNCQIGEQIGIGCCRSWSNPKKPYQPANPWGNHHCDLSPKFYNHTLIWIKKNLNPDFIIFTGDIVAHHDISQTPYKNLHDIDYVSQTLQDLDIPFYPTLGNHDTWPVDQLMDPPYNQWLTENLIKNWNSSLSQTSLKTLLYGGYWTQLLPGHKNLRIISINSLYYDQNNLFLWPNYTLNHAKQWDWLNKTLFEAEQNSEKVWIIGHIFPGTSESVIKFTEKYPQLMTCYKKTVIAQFFGHSHQDSFFLNQNTMGYIAPSLTPLDRNPSLRVYYYNRTTGIILDYEQYRANLSEIIEQDTLKFKLIYSAKSNYSLRDMSQHSWMQYYKKLWVYQTSFTNFYRHYTTGYNVTFCDNKCRTDLLNSIYLK